MKQDPNGPTAQDSPGKVPIAPLNQQPQERMRLTAAGERNGEISQQAKREARAQAALDVAKAKQDNEP